jgi:hypothetical protein
MTRAIPSQAKDSISHINGPARQAGDLRVEHRVGRQISTDKVRHTKYFCSQGTVLKVSADLRKLVFVYIIVRRKERVSRLGRYDTII